MNSKNKETYIDYIDRDRLYRKFYRNGEFFKAETFEFQTKENKILIKEEWLYPNTNFNHREDGPAVIYYYNYRNNDYYWLLNGYQLMYFYKNKLNLEPRTFLDFKFIFKNVYLLNRNLLK